MSATTDLFGLLEFPAPVPDEGAAVTDPLLDVLLSFMKAVLNADVGDAWAEVCPTDPVPVAYVFAHDPDLEDFSTNDTPALYLWRAPDNGAVRYSQDLVVDDAGVQCLWVPPPSAPENRSVRSPIRNGIKKSLRRAFALGRHPAWVVAGDGYYDPATYGSVLLRQAKCGRVRLGQFRPHELVIESEDKSFKSKFDCLFFTVETLEFSRGDPLPEGDLGSVRGTTQLATSDPNAAFLPTLDFRIELSVASVDVDTGPEAGGTVVEITGQQFIEDMAVLFGETASPLVEYVDESTIRATSPAGTGVVDITVVQADGGAERTLLSAFTYA